ncbi:DUF1007 family protein [Salinicola halophilus]|uniref:DUF1007 family protein n=1 Tax=Salinicola halophilus TaxID=184065 RepID=UPI001EF83697|nr:DUF1007 family protein [Salinicola halophilus]
MIRSFYRWGSGLLALVAVGLSSPAFAHPHGWVDISVEGVFDEAGRLAALRQQWRMDPFYSQVVMEEMSSLDDGTTMPERLDALGVEIRNNLATQDNLTTITLDGAPVAQGEVRNTNTEVRGDRLVFSFVLPLASPVPMAGHELDYRIFDPTYYIEMVHEANADGSEPLPGALTLAGAPAGCSTHIVKADPDPSKVMEAAMLDKTESGEPNLGRFFAETGEIRCPA